MKFLACVPAGLALVIPLVAGPAVAGTIHVPGDQPTIQAGIDAAFPGDVVLVAPGTYVGPGNKNLTFDGKDIEVSGAGGPDVTIIDCEGDGRAFFLMTPLSSAARVSGFTIRHGAGGPIDEGNLGGGAIAVLFCSPIIDDCVFEGNEARGDLTTGGGGAIVFHGASSTVTACRFTGNTVIGALASGGAIATHGSSLIVEDGQFAANTAPNEGGAIVSIEFLSVAPPEGWLPLAGMPHLDVSASTFTSNVARFGGAISYASEGTVSGCQFLQNQATSRAGAVAAFTAVLDGCWFSQNSAVIGGAVTGGTLGDCILFDNTATEGGAIANPHAVTGCVLFDNTAIRGGGMSTIGSSLVSATTIADNSGTVGSGVWISNPDFPVAITLTNTIIAFDGGGGAVFCGQNAEALLSCCDVFGNEGGDWVGCLAGQDGGAGNLSADPLFCGATFIEEYSLHPDSPCAPDNTPGACGLIGALPVACGTTPVEPTTWGALKARFER